MKTSLYALVYALVYGALLTGCGAGSPDLCPTGDMLGASDDLSKEDVLIIGDSISIGYTPTVQRELQQFEVLHNRCNARNSTNGVALVDQWLAQRPHFKLVTFNHGIWDHTTGWTTTKAEYLQNLETIARKLQLHADHVVFFTTTSIPVNIPAMDHASVDDWNTDATLLMQSLGITVYDLNATSKTIPHLHIDAAAGTDVHFLPAGYEVLGQSVTSAIKAELGI